MNLSLASYTIFIILFNINLISINAISFKCACTCCVKTTQKVCQLVQLNSITLTSNNCQMNKCYDICRQQYSDCELKQGIINGRCFQNAQIRAADTLTTTKALSPFTTTKTTTVGSTAISIATIRSSNLTSTPKINSSIVITTPTTTTLKTTSETNRLTTLTTILRTTTTTSQTRSSFTLTNTSTSRSTTQTISAFITTKTSSTTGRNGTVSIIPSTSTKTNSVPNLIDNTTKLSSSSSTKATPPSINVTTKKTTIPASSNHGTILVKQIVHLLFGLIVSRFLLSSA